MDGRFDSRIARHLQEDVGLEARVRRGRPAGDSSENVLNRAILRATIHKFPQRHTHTPTTPTLTHETLNVLGSWAHIRNQSAAGKVSVITVS